jgi:hypothetical protein
MKAAVGKKTESDLEHSDFALGIGFIYVAMFIIGAVLLETCVR